jgi:hypothetical protein
MMRRIPLFLAAALFANAALAQDGPTIEVAGWTVAPYFQNAVYGACFAVRPAESSRPGGFNFLGLRPEGTYHVNLRTPHWRLVTGTTYPVAVVVGQATIEGLAEAVGADEISINVSDDPRVIEALASESAIEVRGAGATFRAEYPAAGAAITALQACAREHNPALRNPFASPQAAAPPQGATERSVTQAPTGSAPSPQAARRDPRSSQTGQQVTALFLSGFPEQRGQIGLSALPAHPAHPDQVVMIALATIGTNQGAGLLMVDNPNRGATEDQLVQRAVDELGTCDSGELRRGGRVDLNGLVLLRVLATCVRNSQTPSFSQRPEYAEVLMVIGAQRSHAFIISGEATNREELRRRADLVFESVTASYR